MSVDFDPALVGGPGDLNPHFLARLQASAEKRRIEAAVDVVTASHAKLVAAGTAIDAEVLARLKGQQLLRPLEDCLQVRDGINSARVVETAERLLEKFPLITKVDASGADLKLLDVLKQLRLTPSMQTLLTLYADEREGRLEHTVCVCLLALTLARRLLPGKPQLHRQLALAGLLHDVGELFIPAISQQREVPLLAEQWRSIASHPVIGSRVLARMEGGGPVVAEAVLCHHERLDGFGYPRGLGDEAFKLPNQLLAVSEWLAGLLEVGMDSLMRASVAARLIPGEFDPVALEPIHKALRESPEMSDWLQAQEEALSPRAEPLLRSLNRFGAVQQWIATRGVTAGPQVRAVMLKAYQRMQRLQQSFAGAGLDINNPDRVLADLKDPAMRQELGALLAEFGWRAREMERACLLRASMLGDSDLLVVNEMLEMIRGD